jgi:hypothetical protein
VTPRGDPDDTRRALVRHAASGEHFLVEYCSLWDDRDRVGARVTAGLGPISLRGPGPSDDEPPRPSRARSDAIDAAAGYDPAGAAWLQAEDDGGRLEYPTGVR